MFVIVFANFLPALGIGRATVLCNNATLANHGQEPQELGNGRFLADKWLCPGCELGCIHVHTIAPDTAANIDR